MCPNYACLALGNGKKNDVIGTKIKYTKGQWYWDNKGRNPQVNIKIKSTNCLD